MSFPLAGGKDARQACCAQQALAAPDPVHGKAQHRLEHEPQREWRLKRNCSLAPRQLGLAYLLLCALSLGVSGSFVVAHGAWQVLVYTLAELLAVAIAFLCFARHATDCERIALDDDALLVERESGGKTCRIRLDPQRNRVSGPQSVGQPVRLEARGISAEVGKFISHEKRQVFARELRAALQAYRAMPG
jgi:uncharacterized membrane protein